MIANVLGRASVRTLSNTDGIVSHGCGASSAVVVEVDVKLPSGSTVLAIGLKKFVILDTRGVASFKLNPSAALSTGDIFSLRNWCQVATQNPHTP